MKHTTYEVQSTAIRRHVRRRQQSLDPSQWHEAIDRICEPSLVLDRVATHFFHRAQSARRAKRIDDARLFLQLAREYRSKIRNGPTRF